MSEETVVETEIVKPAGTRASRQMLLYSRVQIAFAVAVVIAAGLFYFGAYRPQCQQIGQLTWDTGTKRLELVADRSQTDRLPREAIELEQLKKRLAGFKKLPSDPQLGEFIHDIHQASERSALQKLVVEPQVARRNALFSEEPIDLNFTGDFSAVSQFIGAMEDMKRLTRVSDLSVHSVDARRGTVEVKLSVNIYYGEAS